jgi:hypothetical protein
MQEESVKYKIMCLLVMSIDTNAGEPEVDEKIDQY